MTNSKKPVDRKLSKSNAEIGELLRRLAGALVLEGADRYKIKAYRRAAEMLETHPENIADYVQRGGDLLELPGIGKAINEKILEILASGNLPQLERSLSKLKPELVELSTKPRLDPKLVQRIYKTLGIKTLAELQSQLEIGNILKLFGSRVDFQIRQGLDERPRELWWSANKWSLQVEDFLKGIPGVTQVARVGSLRRCQETVGDLNFLVTGSTATAVFKLFTKYGAVESSEVIKKNRKRFRLALGRSITVTWTPQKTWGLELLIHTGSPGHLQELQSQLPIAGTLTAKFFGAGAADEESVYKKLGLSYIESELREGRGEVAAAAQNKLPLLVQLADLRGDLHMHTTDSDGANTLVEMAASAKEKGYQYIAITDHSQSLKITNGLSEKRLLQHVKAIDRLNTKLKGITILKSAEVDILEDGSLDYPNGILKHLDLTICSIHSRFALNKEQQTERILRAMDNPYFNILGHATGRLLLKREGYQIDILRLIKHSKANGCYFEINSSPDRLDLSAEHAKIAKDAGIKIAINTDAHSTEELNFITGGINQGRRAWLEPKDVLNTYSLPKLLKILQR